MTTGEGLKPKQRKPLKIKSLSILESLKKPTENYSP